MGDLTPNISRHELSCNCGCGFDTADFELITILQETVDYFSKNDNVKIRISVTGPNRCVKHNTEEGGSDNSQHIYARAVDFKLFNSVTSQQIYPERVVKYLDKKYPGKFGIGRYINRTHFDTRTNGPARWDMRANNHDRGNA